MARGIQLTMHLHLQPRKRTVVLYLRTTTHLHGMKGNFTFYFILYSKHCQTCILTAYDKCIHTLKIILHKVVVTLLFSHHISCQDTSPGSQAHSSPFYKGCCSLHPPSHVHRHTVPSLGHTNYCSDTHRHCCSPCHSVLVDSVSHTAPHPTLPYTDMLQSQGHSQYCCHHGSYTQGYTPVQTTLTRTSVRTAHPYSLVDRCMYLQTEHNHQYTSISGKQFSCKNNGWNQGNLRNCRQGTENCQCYLSFTSSGM